MSPSRFDDVVLSVNCGSSSLKFALFGVHGDTPRHLAIGVISGIGTTGGLSSFQVVDRTAESLTGRRRGPHVTEETEAYPDHDSALQAALRLLDDAGAPEFTLAGHRIVHGGDRFVRPTKIDQAVVESLTKLVPLAPLHLPAALAGIRAIFARRPSLPQVACFDTAFHRSMSACARRIPLPDIIDREGVRRYGFHGLSYEYVMSTLGPEPPSRVVIAHLGNGSSLVAVKDGVSIDTTMGFTPSGGIMMGTRTGDLDPGVVVYLLREKNLSPSALEQLVDHESGLVAVGGSSDMKTLLASDGPREKLAVEMFSYGVRKAIGSLAAALGGLDLLVFTGGIGEHAAEIRRAACDELQFLGVEIDPERNRGGDGIVSTDGSRCAVRVVPTDEDLVIARHVLAVERSAPR